MNEQKSAMEHTEQLADRASERLHWVRQTGFRMHHTGWDAPDGTVVPFGGVRRYLEERALVAAEN